MNILIKKYPNAKYKYTDWVYSLPQDYLVYTYITYDNYDKPHVGVAKFITYEYLWQ